MTRKQKKKLTRIVAAAVLLALARIAERLWIPEEMPLALIGLALYLLPYFIVGFDVLRTAVIHIAHRQIFDENFLMAIATVGAFFCGEYPEAVFVMLFFEVGELFESIAVGSSRRSIAALTAFRPDEARVLRDGAYTSVSPDDVAVGERIEVRPGERVPLDGVIVDGAASLDTSALTGESLPREVTAGDEALSGCVCLGGVLHIETTRSFGESSVSRILDLVENASASKSKSERFISRFAAWYTPAVVCFALALAVLPPLLDHAWRLWIGRALTFLVVSCPCALVISVPLSYFGALGGASRRGILIKGSGFMETLAAVRTVAFDKTGTLTRGAFTVSGIRALSYTKEDLLEFAAAAETYSSHPVALALREANLRPIDSASLTDLREIAGQGITARYRGIAIAVGNRRLMEEQSAPPALDAISEDDGGTLVCVAVDHRFAGVITVSDTLKENAVRAITDLRACGVKKTVLLTGDRAPAAAAAAAALGVDEWHAELLPQDKLTALEKLLAVQKKGDALAFIGDGINDSPVLARADLGIAMGALGSDAAIEAADVVLMDDDPAKIAEAISLSRRTARIVRQNIVFALAVKAAALLLGALGIVGLGEAVFADVGVLILAVLNAMRTLRVPSHRV